MRFVLSVDAGTTGVTALLVGPDARVHASAYREFPQYFPQPGWVSHDAEEIWTATRTAATEALTRGGVAASEVAAIGITNQRETAVVWDRATGRPIDHAVVWQCRRTAARCDELRASGHEPTIRDRTGLVADAYFSGTKVEWLLDTNEGAREAAERGDLAFGTVDSWLIHRLTGGRVHATDPSNASRTMLFGLRTLDWDPEMLSLLRVPAAVLPEVMPSSGRFGVTDPDAFGGAEIPISGVAGDQQAALFGQGCHQPGRSKNTYGTGSFLLLNTGSEPPPVTEGLLSTVAWTVDGRTDYALEGAIFVTGASLQWLRDGLGVISSYDEAEPLAASVPDAGGVVFVPAFVGLGSPYWDPYARGTVTGLTRGSTRAHLVRAAIEAMAHQSVDVMEAMERASGTSATELRVDGGAVRMDLLCQLQADLGGVPVLRPEIRETTALGAAFLAGLAEGVWDDLEDLDRSWRLDRRFEPAADPSARRVERDRWRRAVERARAWETPSQ
ncbi:MAG TPA: glycerol kinase GlpK [Actinomycetota bacterium]|nr:glycerol kinase GlpK [Actinomycetota bacterium]